ncbi:hypothetical protein Mapa_005738 [Marchantia paleacea]|nr:hypothetical protein Mapa_005738 [Marchantia paleacea]
MLRELGWRCIDSTQMFNVHRLLYYSISLMSHLRNSILHIVILLCLIPHIE